MKNVKVNECVINTDIDVVPRLNIVVESINRTFLYLLTGKVRKNVEQGFSNIKNSVSPTNTITIKDGNNFHEQPYPIKIINTIKSHVQSPKL